MTPLVRRALARALFLLASLSALGVPASAQFGFQPPTGPATAPCPVFSGLPLSLNLGQRADGLDGISSRCGFQRMQDGVNLLAGQRAQPNGIATLDANGLVPLSQIPAYNFLPGAVPSLTITGPGSSGPVDGMTVMPGPSAVARTLSDKLAERPSWLDYSQAIDLGDCAPAIERAANAGIKALFFSSRIPCNLKRTVNLPNATLSLVGDGRKTAEIRLLGNNDVFFNVGNSTTVSYNFFVDNILFTKEQQSLNSGAVLKLTNVYKWGISHSRIYGSHNIYRVLDITSSSNSVNYDVDVEEIRDRVVYATCGTAPPGNPGGQCYDMKFDHWYAYGSNDVATDADSGGAFVFMDNFQAIVIENSVVGKHRGYAYDLRGTLANRGNNALNFIVNPNVEADYANTGIARFGAVGSSQIGGSVSWVSSRGGANGTAFPGISLSKDSVNITVKGMQIGMAAAGAVGVYDDGARNRVEDLELVGYDSNADLALQVGPDATRGTYKRISASQLKRVIADQSPDSAGHVYSGFEYDYISGQPLTGLVGSTTSNKVIDSITDLGAGPPTVAAATMLSLPDKGKAFTLTSSGTINGITPTYYGREVTLFAAQPGVVFRNTQSAPGTGAFYIPGGASGADITCTNAPCSITAKWMGDFYWVSSIAR